MRTFIRPWLVVLLFLLGYLLVVAISRDQGSKTFVTLGTCYSQCLRQRECSIPEKASRQTAEALEGYDGQFNYYIARDPAAAAPCLDVPAYRYQRILLPILGWLFSAGGQVTVIPYIFLLINSVALLGSVRLIETLLEQEKRSIWFALSYGLFIGVLMPVRLSTSEPLAYGLVIVGIWAHQREIFPLMLVSLALAAFAKETTLVMTAGFGLCFLLKKQWQLGWLLAAGVGLPFVIWQFFLYQWLGAAGVGSGGAKATPFEIIPFMGVLKIWSEGNLLAFILLGVFFIGLFVLLPTLWGLLMVWKDFSQRKITFYTCLLFTSVAMMPFVPFSTYREFIGLVRFIPGLVVMVVLYSAERHLKRPLLYSTLWVVLLLFLSAG